MGDFDSADRSRWYFGVLNREEADKILQRAEIGTFLVRDSTRNPGDFALCVKEDNRVAHYIITRKTLGHGGIGGARFEIGERPFACIQSLLNYYKSNYLDTTLLIRPAEKQQPRVIARFDYAGQDSGGLPFKEGDILTVIEKDEENWWIARNSRGNQGFIPVTYVKELEEEEEEDLTMVDPIHANHPNADAISDGPSIHI